MTHRHALKADHPAVQAAARAALAEGWTCDTHEPLPWGECRDCTESPLRTARRALTAALPHLTADDRRDGEHEDGRPRFVKVVDD